MPAFTASASSAKRGAFRPTKRQTGRQHAQEEQTRRVGDVGAREDAADSGTRHSAPDMAKKAVQTVWELFETALDLDDDADRYKLFDTAHALAEVYLPPDWLGSKPIVS